MNEPEQGNDDAARTADGRTSPEEDLPELEPQGRPRRRLRTRRSPVLAALVILGGLYLLFGMWPDFRYWLRGDGDLRDLGTVDDIYREGGFVDDFDNLYVVVEGTPDVQHAARMKTDKGSSGYLRLREAGGSLFAAVPREDERPHDRFEGRFEGRMRELGDTWSYAYVEEFFNAEEILHTTDVEPDELLRALREGDASLTVAGEERKITLGEDDRIRIVVAQPDAAVQLGKKTWPRAEDAEAAIEALGVPWVRLDRDSGHFHSFVVRVPAGERDALRARLDAGHDVPADNPDPKVGAMVLPRTATYVVAPEDVGASGDGLVFEYGDNTSVPGYAVDGDLLVEKKLDEGRLAVGADDLDAVRIERKVRVDPEGYVIIVEDTPSQHWLDALLFLLVTGLVLVNVAALAVAIRRRRA